jgi:triphosphatase
MEAVSPLSEARPVEAPRLAPDLTVGGGLRVMLLGALNALDRHQSSSRAPGPDAVHRFRIGLRRLRSILSAFADVLPEDERRALSDRLRAAAQRYGRARDWDVFLARTIGRLRETMPGDPALGLLVKRAQAARRGALPPGETLPTGIAAVEAAVGDAFWLRRPAPALAAAWDRPLADYGRALLEKRHLKLRKRVKAVDLAEPPALHDVRIRVKKLRYPAELLGSLFDERGASAYLDRLVALQALLGGMNDAVTGRTLVLALQLPLDTQHLVLARLGDEFDKLRERFPDAAHAFRQVPVFWP